ncbi:ferritin family protein [Oscillospiraceae bacterium MB08-C2-2]|nr:ferritin family protein [Oscillospiraceae bacterium MB08-C2-2]
MKSISPDQYILDEPYPKVILQPSDRKYACMLSDIYAGKGSETTAIAQYRVHVHYLTDLPQIHKAYEGIAGAEMIHQDLLGNLICEMGASPILLSGVTNCYWNGIFPDYQCRLPAILESDAQGERNAIAHYTRIANCVTNTSLQALIYRIIQDEQLHLKFLLSLLDEYE